MSVYAKENPAFLQSSLQSIMAQTRRPDEIIVVKDGALPGILEDVIAQYANLYAGLFNIVGYSDNR